MIKALEGFFAVVVVLTMNYCYHLIKFKYSCVTSYSRSPFLPMYNDFCPLGHVLLAQPYTGPKFKWVGVVR